MSKQILRNIFKFQSILSSRLEVTKLTQCSVSLNKMGFNTFKTPIYSSEQTATSPKLITPVSPQSAFRCSVNNPVKKKFLYEEINSKSLETVFF